MKSIRVGGARVVVVAIGLTIAALAYTVAPGSSVGKTDVPSRLETVPGQSSRLEAEAEIIRTDIVRKLEGALGSAFGGVWFEPSTAQLHVGVTSPESRRAAGAAAAQEDVSEIVTETLVYSSWAQLIAAQERWNHRLADLLERAEAATSLAPDRNSVEVELGESVPSSRRAALQREASVADVDVSIDVATSSDLGIKRLARCNKFAKAEAFCNPPIVAGVLIEDENGAMCTAGPAVVRKDKSTPGLATETYLLTAGHCIDQEYGGGGVGAKWFAYNKKEEGKGGEKKEIGEAIVFLNEVIDMGVIKVDNPGYWANKGFVPVTPTIAPWQEAAPEPFNVTGPWEPVKGTESCYSGMISGTACGTIKTVNLTVGKTEKLTEVEKVAGEEGDSGGPWFAKGSPSLVEGTMVGEWIKNKTLLFQTLLPSLEELNKYELLIKGEEIRHPFKFQVESAPVTLTGNQDGKSSTFTTTVGMLKCTEGTFTGSQSEAEVVEIGLTPAYAGCTAFGLPASVDVNGCTYRFTATKLEAGGKREGNVDIVCPAGKEITVTAGSPTIKCTIDVPPQENLGSVTYTNVGAGATREITIDLNLTGIKYTHTAGTGLGKCAGGSAANGTYEGAIAITAEKAGGGHVGFFSP